MDIQVSGTTDIGMRRTINQDAFIYKTAKVEGEYVGLYAVADGVGGWSMGEHASSIAIQRINKWWQLELPRHYGRIESVINSLVKRVEKINNDITLYSRKHRCNMATTLSILLIYKGMYYVLHIGDSKIFRVNHTIEQITVDHLMDKKLTQYLGGQRSEFEYHMASGEIKTNDFFVVGSDGMFNRIKSNEIYRLVHQISGDEESLKQACVTLIQRVKRRGETDNITVIMLNIKK